MILKSKVQKARIMHKCSWCRKTIMPNEHYRYMYGAPEIYDAPYALKYCLKCDKEHNKHEED